MSEAIELGLVVETIANGDQGWALARQGQREIDATRAWFTDAMGRFARQIQDRAIEDFGGLSSEIAGNWAQLILQLFSNEIARSATTYAGEVERGSAGKIRPIVLDGRAMLGALEAKSIAPESLDFLKACLLAAVDEADPFGNELVGHVATSCVLHAIAAGRSRAAAREALGTLEGRRVLLDTPILVAYLGPAEARKRLKTLVAQSKSLKMEVVAPDHVFDELDDVIKRVTEEHLQPLVQALKSGTSPRAYAQTVNEQVLELFLDGLEEKTYKNWNDFQTRVKGLPEELAALGVLVRAHGNKDRGNVAWIDQELTKELAGAMSGRGARAIARDAESIEMVWRTRRRFLRDRQSLWPGGWIISYDRRINPAYKRVANADGEPLVLTPAQWAALMTEAAPAAEVRELIEAAASYIRQESMLRIATKYPPSVALALAKSLSGEFVSKTDERLAQLSLADMLDLNANGETITGERIISEITSRRTNRLAAAGLEQQDAASKERVRLSEAIVQSTFAIDVAKNAQNTAEIKLARLEAREQLAARRTIRAIITTVGVAVTVLLIVLQFWGFAGGTAFSTVVFFILSRAWIREPNATFGALFLSLIPEVLGAIDVIDRLQH